MLGQCMVGACQDSNYRVDMCQWLTDQNPYQVLLVSLHDPLRPDPTPQPDSISEVSLFARGNFAIQSAQRHTKLRSMPGGATPAASDAQRRTSYPPAGFPWNGEIK